MLLFFALVFCTTIISTDINCTIPKGKMTAWLLLIRQQPFETFKSRFLFHSIRLSLSLVFSFSLHSDSIQFYIIQPMWFTWVFNVTLETEEEADEAVRANGRTMKWKSMKEYELNKPKGVSYRTKWRQQWTWACVCLYVRACNENQIKTKRIHHNVEMIIYDWIFFIELFVDRFLRVFFII